MAKRSKLVLTLVCRCGYLGEKMRKEFSFPAELLDTPLAMLCRDAFWRPLGGCALTGLRGRVVK